MADDSSFGGESVPQPGTFGTGLSFGDGGGAAAGLMDAQGADVPPTAPPGPAQCAPRWFRRRPQFWPKLQRAGPCPCRRLISRPIHSRSASSARTKLRPIRCCSSSTPRACKRRVISCRRRRRRCSKSAYSKPASRQASSKPKTLGLRPGEVPDEATQADRVEVAKARALQGDLRVFKGLQAVDPKSAEAIQDQVHEVAAGHLNKAQFAFDKLSNMRNQGEYTAAVNSLRRDGTLADLEALGPQGAGHV